jgi:hypothetical protein
LVTDSLGDNPTDLAFDGTRIWTSNPSGSVSIVSFGFGTVNVNTVSAGFDSLHGILYDGANIWVTNWTVGRDELLKLNSAGAIIQTITVDHRASYPLFDGSNIWVPNEGDSNSLTVVRASTGTVLATLTGNGLDGPRQAAFDGERILVVNGIADTVSLWRASDLTPLGSFPMGAGNFPIGVCSDGLNFWIILQGQDLLARF